MTHWGEIEPSMRQALEQAGLDCVTKAFAYQQGQELHKPKLGTRRRTRLTVTDESGASQEVYLKRYGPDPWWRRLGKFSSPAKKEFQAIQRVHQAGVPTMQALVFEEECPLMSGRSFLVVSAVPGESLERGGRALFEQPGPAVEALTDQLAAMVRRFHQAGLAHRDLYACHIFVQVVQPHMGKPPSAEPTQFYLIDLARVFAPRWRRFRWRVKDLSQLHFSMPPAWVQQYWPRFMQQYLGSEAAGELACYQRAIGRKSAAIRRRCERRAARAGSGGAA